MSELIVTAEERTELGKNANRRLRLGGKIPGVVYGRGLEPMSIAINPGDLIEILESDSGRNTIFALEIGKGSREVLIKDLQLDPIKGTLVHADFQYISKDQVMEFQVPVEVLGEAEGVKTSGGIMDVVLREIHVQCLPMDVPDNISVDVSDVDIGGSIRVSELAIDDSKVTVLSDPDLVVLSVLAPRVEEEPEVVVEEEEGVEPEVIKKGKEEEEAGEKAPEESSDSKG
jgi:large subunit ribosomal protein L25